MLDKGNLQKAITKGLNKSHGKALAEQVRTIMDTIGVFEDVLGDNSLLVVGDGPREFGGTSDMTFQGGILTSINPPSQPQVIEMPARLGAKSQNAIDGVNFRESQDIMLRLNDLPTEIILNGPNGAPIKAYKMVSSGISVGKSDCIELRYVPGGFDNKTLTCARFWTSDPEFDPAKGFNEVHRGMQNFIDTLSKIENIKPASLPPARMPSTDEMIATGKSDEFSRSELDASTWNDKNAGINSNVQQLFYSNR